MSEYVYQWRDGRGIGGLAPDVAAQELGRIEEAAGGLTPASVVEASRDEAAPLHPVFTWDDTKAGENWRRQEARSLIRSIEVIRDDDASKTAVPVFVSVTSPDTSQRYMPTATVAADSVLMSSARASLTAQISGIRRTLAGLTWLAQSKGEEHAAIVQALTGLEQAVDLLKVAA